MVQLKPELEFDPEDETVSDDQLFYQLQKDGVDIEDVCFRHRPLMVELPDDDSDDNNDTKQVKTEFMYAEHGYIGDSICLAQPDGKRVCAKKAPFILQNGLELTYGQISGLAGDFYGTSKPISCGSDMNDQCRRFEAAYATLAMNKRRQPREAMEILEVLKDEVKVLNEALRNHKRPSEAYSKLKFPTAEFRRLTRGRPFGQPGFLGLALRNWDHWGDDARKAYNAGHTAALQTAAGGSDQDLLTAYSMNAFADHFLEDSFAAGHIRGPRKKLRAPLQALCILYMHDEDNAIGLKVRDPDNKEFEIYGDKRMFDPENAENMRRCKCAVQASADEIYEAWKTRSASRKPADFKAWTFACTIASARSDKQVLAPLFRFNDGWRRSNINDRRTWKFERVKPFGYLKMLYQLKDNPRWDYPMKLDN